MAITFTKVTVINPARPKKTRTHEFLVDSGAFYTVMPTGDLEALGIKPSRKESFLLANGEITQAVEEIVSPSCSVGARVGVLIR